MTIQRMADAAQRYADAVSYATDSATPGVNRTSTTSNGATTNQQVKEGAVVQLSPGAQFFAQLLSLAAASPEVRSDKVAANTAQSGQDLTTQGIEQLADKLMPSQQP